MKAPGHLACAAVLLCSGCAARGENPVIVHEWGTFTSLQDENGKAIGGINVDDEPVPNFVYGAGFVHDLNGANAYNFGLPPYPLEKGWRPADQDVTMRLETPVIYFYPPKDDAQNSALRLTVHVDFHGGLLSQYYPYAEMQGFPNMLNPQQEIHLADCNSGLTWTVTHFGSAQEPPETPDKVWTTPREVSAPEIEVKGRTWNQNGDQQATAEAEHFLFYRGVGHLNSPILLAPDGSGQKGSMEMGAATRSGISHLNAAWIVDIHENGVCAFRDLAQTEAKDALGPLTIGHVWFPNFSASFEEADFRRENLSLLKNSMQTALMKAGLYHDEASAMLRTWELSYFKSPGLRFFYIVPPSWLDKTLPLMITGAPVDITRVMVGRIELISDEQKATLARLANEPCPNLADLKQQARVMIAAAPYSRQDADEFQSGARPLTDLGITLSPSVRDYLSLGRFRDALIVHEQAEHPSDNLAQFIKDNDLAAR